MSKSYRDVFGFIHAIMLTISFIMAVMIIFYAETKTIIFGLIIIAFVTTITLVLLTKKAYITGGRVLIPYGFPMMSSHNAWYIGDSNTSYDFDINNIDKIRCITDNKEKKNLEEKRNSMKRFFSSMITGVTNGIEHVHDFDRAVHITFKKPLQFKQRRGQFNMGYPVVREIYFSLAEPEKFVADVKKLMKKK